MPLQLPLLPQSEDDDPLLAHPLVRRSAGIDRPAIISQAHVPDALWASDNPVDIPVLDLEWQADAVDLPFVAWGSIARTRQMCGTYHFYVDDYRFKAIWSNPHQIVNSGCVAVVEPNYSLFEQTPVAMAFYATYMKRWLARYWQSQSIRIFIDLNVAVPHREINLLGVPFGWRAYATRGYTDRMEQLEVEYDLACTRRGGRDIIFVVYGGGKEISKYCRYHGFIHLPERADVVKLNYNRRLLHG